jgi:hypothetical protein
MPAPVPSRFTWLNELPDIATDEVPKPVVVVLVFVLSYNVDSALVFSKNLHCMSLAALAIAHSIASPVHA